MATAASAPCCLLRCPRMPSPLQVGVCVCVCVCVCFPCRDGDILAGLVAMHCECTIREGYFEYNSADLLSWFDKSFELKRCVIDIEVAGRSGLGWSGFQLKAAGDAVEWVLVKRSAVG